MSDHIHHNICDLHKSQIYRNGDDSMSQEKIDAYKKEKSGRKERIAKQKKRNKILRITGIIAGAAIVIAIAGAIVWNRVEASNAAAEAAAAETEASAEESTTATENASAETSAE